MTDEEALREAFRRWSNDAYVQRRPRDPLLPKRSPYAVGRQVGKLFEVRGQGYSWEETFADADANGR
jgi:hypothetical protein